MTTKITPVRTSVTAAATKLFSANIYAKFREFRNLDAANDIAWGNDNTVTFATGHILKAGEVASFDTNPPTGEIWAIANTSLTANVSGVEY